MTEQAGTKQKTKAKATNSAKSVSAANGGSAAVRSRAVRADEQPAAAPVIESRHAVLRYTTLRLALFLVALLVVWAVALIFNMDLSSQLSKLTLLAVALLLSSAASFIVLSKQRDAMSAGIVARTQRLSRKFDDAASFEDDDEE
jgi:hypothetical protein